MSTTVMSAARLELRVTEIELCAWLGAAVPGEQIVYHRGFLAFDADPAAARLPARERTELARLARRARLAADAGLAHLVQRRHGPSDYSYILIARPRPKAIRGSILTILAAEVDL